MPLCIINAAVFRQPYAALLPAGTYVSSTHDILLLYCWATIRAMANAPFLLGSLLNGWPFCLSACLIVGLLCDWAARLLASVMPCLGYQCYKCS